MESFTISSADMTPEDFAIVIAAFHRKEAGKSVVSAMLAGDAHDARIMRDSWPVSFAPVSNACKGLDNAEFAAILAGA